MDPNLQLHQVGRSAFFPLSNYHQCPGGAVLTPTTATPGEPQCILSSLQLLSMLRRCCADPDCSYPM